MANRLLPALLALIGAVATIAGLLGVLAGTDGMAGDAGATPNVEGELRYYAAFYVGFGVAALWAARRGGRDGVLVRALAATMFLGGCGRALGWAAAGRPQAGYLVLLALELLLPVALVALSRRAYPARPAAGRR